MMEWLLIYLIAALLNLIPLFMPPTWALLAFFHINRELDVVPLAVVGALGAVTGRAGLALLARSWGPRIVPARWQHNITALSDQLRSHPSLGLPALALFALGPIPSSQLLIAAGLARTPLAPVLLVFGLARFVSYILWVEAANLTVTKLSDLFSSKVGGGAAILAQIVGFAILIAIMQVDWASLFQRWSNRRA
ncbi:MAG: hypothetical protein ACKOCK_02300 [Chloroflexota bacterium]